MLLTLFLVPCLYVIVQNAAATLARLLTGTPAPGDSRASGEASPAT